MTKRKTETTKEEPDKYVVLTRIAYKAMLPERELIEPYRDENGNIDPYHQDAPRITLEHLNKADINLLIMRKIVAPDKN